MKIVFVSNYLNHHQLPLCKALLGIPEVQFTFIAMTSPKSFRIKLGYVDINHRHDFVLCVNENGNNKEKANYLCKNCDVLLFTNGLGSGFIKNCNVKKQLVIYLSEHIYKNGTHGYKYYARIIKHSLKHGQYKNAYLLCSSAYAANDYAKVGSFKGRAYKWGYFPPLKKYDVDSLMNSKRRDGTVKLLWVGRLIDWKHPELSIMLAERLMKANIAFELDLIGVGDMSGELKKMVDALNLNDCVHFLGSMGPDEVRAHMEQANIFLHTSDHNEGWGAVLNEAMNSGCAVLANIEIGAAPFLIEEQINGLVYRNEQEFYELAEMLSGNPELCEKYGREAYKTITEKWNANIAADRLIRLINCLQKGENTPFADGICSKA